MRQICRYVENNIFLKVPALLLLTHTPTVSHSRHRLNPTLSPPLPLKRKINPPMAYGGWARVHYDGPDGWGAGWGRPVISISADKRKHSRLLPFFLSSCFAAPASSVVFVWRRAYAVPARRAWCRPRDIS